MVFFNENLPVEERAWNKRNGATRRELMVVNKLGMEIQSGSGVDCRIGKLDKENISFLFINPGKDPRVLGVFLLDGYGWSVKEGTEIWSASSRGGYGNSESKVGIYELGTVLYTHTYKNRRAGTYHRLTDSGWVVVPAHEIIEEEDVEYV